jgi:hypothetical protein
MRDLLIVYALVVLYAAAYQMQAPVEPFLVDRLLSNPEGGVGVVDGDGDVDTATTYAKLKSLFSLTQSIGSLAL